MPAKYAKPNQVMMFVLHVLTATDKFTFFSKMTFFARMDLLINLNQLYNIKVCNSPTIHTSIISIDNTEYFMVNQAFFIIGANINDVINSNCLCFHNIIIYI